MLPGWLPRQHPIIPEKPVSVHLRSTSTKDSSLSHTTPTPQSQRFLLSRFNHPPVSLQPAQLLHVALGIAGHRFPEEQPQGSREDTVLPWLTADSQARPPLCASASPFEPKLPIAGESGETRIALSS